VNLNWLDYLLIVVLALSMLQSFRRGFSREFIGLGAAIAALVLGMWFYGSAGSLVKRWLTLSSDRAADFIGFLLIVFSVLLLGAIVGSIVRRFVKAVGLSFFDRLLGACFGFARGALVAIALLTGYIAFGPRSESGTAPSAVVHSQIAPYLMKVSSVFVDAAPMELKRNFREVYNVAQLEIKNIARPDTKGVANDDPGMK
jgi:membrane protein required for colicin V production